MVRSLVFPALPPPPMVWSGRGGGLAWAERGRGGWDAVWVDRAGILRKLFTSRAPYHIGHVPVSIPGTSLLLNPVLMQALRLKQDINRHPNQPTPQTLPKLLSTRSLLTFKVKPSTPKPHNHTTGRRGNPPHPR